MRIDIGGGTKPLEGHVNLDPVHGEGGWKRMAQDVPWPVAGGSVDGVHASHVLEHVPAGWDRIAVFNEVHRVLRPGGLFTVIVPLFPWAPAIADPTHVSWWIEDSFAYFEHRMAPCADYGIARWERIRWSVRDQWEGTWVGMRPDA